MKILSFQLFSYLLLPYVEDLVWDSRSSLLGTACWGSMAFVIEFSPGMYIVGEDCRFFLPGTIGTQGFLLWSYSTFYIVRLHCALDMDVVVLRG